MTFDQFCEKLEGSKLYPEIVQERGGLWLQVRDSKTAAKTIVARAKFDPERPAVAARDCTEQLLGDIPT